MNFNNLVNQSNSDTKISPNVNQANTRNRVSNILDLNIDSYIKEKEKAFPQIEFNSETIKKFIDIYNLDLESFEKYFFSNNYNKTILLCSSDIVDYVNLDEINNWEDLVAYVIKQISLTKDEFKDKVVGKIDILTFPNLSTSNIAQSYFYTKIVELLPDTKIIFWDNPEIRKYLWENQVKSNSVWFIDLLWNWYFNTCLLKLLKTIPCKEKINELNKLFSNIQEDEVFIWWSTDKIPFNTPHWMKWIILPKRENNWKLKLLPNWLLLNSMWYLNSAYYTDKAKWSFVLWSHNIAEPMHAWKLTVINNEPKNRYNHNWIISYFWEKTWLLFFSQKEDDTLEEFLSISDEELQERNKHFQELYNNEIIPLIYWIIYLYLAKNYPCFIK